VERVDTRVVGRTVDRTRRTPHCFYESGGTTVRTLLSS
jgi:hypothetical protein